MPSGITPRQHKGDFVLKKPSEDIVRSTYDATRSERATAEKLGISRRQVHKIVSSQKPDSSQRQKIFTLPKTIDHRSTFQLPDYRRIAFLSCTHHPYQDKAAVGSVLNYVAANDFDLVVLAGDQCDFYKISRFSQDPRRLVGIQEEIDETKKFIKNVESLNRSVVWIDGNHDDRMRRFIAETNLSGLEALRIPNLFGLPESWTYAENQAHIRVGSLLMCHGDLAGRGQGTRHLAHGMFDKLHTSVLFGHFHRFDRYYHSDYDRVQRAAFACAHLCDESAADYVRAPGWQTGFCEVEYDHSENIFSVRDHVIVRGKFYAGGRVWK